MPGKIIKLWFSGINRKSNYKSLVDLFKGRGCGQSLKMRKQQEKKFVI